ncbi:ACP S-malonyltransferase [Xanthomonas bonasiae]|uniref:ACP S-malonyltransferase n=1 Tax=Xanthomonas bonasiae TaxID=2810351 RepID=UPI00177C5032|nr:ACP S-malonyltransferase [Xanthomonas surreyensis]MBD7923975.1 ACP S-malonyltransferase [Xanthomonas surreyensis]
MTTVWVFPGQGSQHKGMGGELFGRYPELVAQADAVLGYSLRELCLEDPNGLLNQTEYTQPALFAVSALAFLQARDEGAAVPQVFAGHSLGEFAALFAAGAFDFATGIELVAKRGALMAQAPRGAMAAIIGPELAHVRTILDQSGLSGVDIANINSDTQHVISGLHEDIGRCEAVFAGAGARFVRLKVSAAFHSRYMREVENAYAEFVGQLFEQGRLHPLRADVVSNRTARPHAREAWLPKLIEQISHPVNWYESMSWLLAQGEVALREIGPGDVLSGLFVKIRKAPMILSAATEPARFAVKPRIVFMYSGQGSQYYGMGRELYAKNAAFREAMDACNAIYRDMTSRDLVAELYDEASKRREMTDIGLSHPAIFSIGYGLTQAMAHAGIRPDAVLGYSLGEYAASVAAGTLLHEDAMRIVIRQAGVFRSEAAGGGMLTVMAPVGHFHSHPELYGGTAIGSVNFDGNFVVSGSRAAIDDTRRKLDARAVVSMRLPVEYPFHSPLLAPIEPTFLRMFDGVPISVPSIAQYSSATGGRLERVEPSHYWKVTSEMVDFRAAVAAIAAEGPCRFVDLGPTGTLSGFIKYGYGDRLEQITTINQFGRNAETVAGAIDRLAA